MVRLRPALPPHPLPPHAHTLQEPLAKSGLHFLSEGLPTAANSPALLEMLMVTDVKVRPGHRCQGEIRSSEDGGGDGMGGDNSSSSVKQLVGGMQGLPEPLKRTECGARAALGACFAHTHRSLPYS